MGYTIGANRVINTEAGGRKEGDSCNWKRLDWSHPTKSSTGMAPSILWQMVEFLNKTADIVPATLWWMQEYHMTLKGQNLSFSGAM